MAELCRKCFIETWHPNAYDIEHIVMSEENDFCEGCLDCVPYVDYIDTCDMLYIPNAEFFALAVNTQRKLNPNSKFACVECGAIFDDDDLAFTYETGLCQYCHKAVMELWVKQ